MEPWLEELWDERGTDLLLQADAPPLLRVDAEVRPVYDGRSLSEEDARAVVHGALGPALLERYLSEHEVDFAFSWRQHARVRCHAYRQRGAHALACRMLPYEVPTLGELGLPPAVETLLGASASLVVVAGPAGSGTTTTLAAMVDHVNRTRRCHVVSIEDPIEYVHGRKLSLVSQREVRTDTAAAPTVRAVLRENADVVLLATLDRPDWVDAAVTLAEGGLLVLGALHLPGAREAIGHLSGAFEPSYRDQARLRLASVLGGVVTQRLLVRKEGGLVGAYEAAVAGDELHAFLTDASANEVRQLSGRRPAGTPTLETAIQRLVDQGVVDADGALWATPLTGKLRVPARS